MRELLDREEGGPYLLNKGRALQRVAEECQACAQVSPGKAKIRPRIRPRGHRPSAHWELDFTEVKPRTYRYRYLLVFVDTFSR